MTGTASPTCPYPSRVPGNPNATVTYVESFVEEDEVLAEGRRRADEVGCGAVSASTGALLRLLSTLLDARSVVEIGTGAGVSGTWLLRGMHPEGVLTSIDTEVEHQRLARETFAAEGVPANRARLINGAAQEVLPRLTDGGYDLVFVDGNPQDCADHLEAALRLLRAGGVVAFDHALWGERVADPAQRDPDTIAMRELGRTVREHEELVPALLTTGDGLLVAVRR